MTPEQEQQLKDYLQGIAQILYDESDSEAMKTLEDIELVVREQVQKHVNPEIGIFLSKKLQEPRQASLDISKAPWES